MSLNEGQKAAHLAVQDFLAEPSQKFFNLEAGGGYGKTYFLNSFEKDIPSLNKRRKALNMPLIDSMYYSATTHKAASLLGSNAETLFSLLKIRPQTNYKTGNTSYTTFGDPLRSGLIVIDEGSMIHPDVFPLIDSQLQGSAKSIISLDPYQLAPVGCDTPIVDSMGFPTATLTEPMRQNKDSHLFKTCDVLRDAVRTQTYVPPRQGAGIRCVSGPEFQREYVNALRNGEDARIVTFTNTSTESHNRHVRMMLHGTSDFREGDLVVAANALKGDVRIERSYRIEYIGPVIEGSILPYMNVSLNDGGTYKVPANKKQYFALLKSTYAEGKASGNWALHYKLKEEYLDIRDGFACTAYKAQGSTYDKVFIDFANMCVCRDLNSFLRMLYVGVSRARTEVVVYGL